MGHRKKSFEEKVVEHEQLKAAAHKVIDQMTRLELHRFFIRRKHYLEQEPQMAAKEETQ
jgi:hypothetical protein